MKRTRPSSPTPHEADRLVTDGRAALDDGAFDAAAVCFREALSLAPMRPEIRDLLARAIEAKLHADVSAAPTQPTEPKPVAVPTAAPPDPPPPAPSRLDEGHPMFVEGERDDAEPPARSSPWPALLIGALMGLLIAGAAAWWLLAAHPLDLPGLNWPVFQDIRAERVIEQARQHRRRGEYSLAIEQIKALPDGPARRQALVETFMEQGDGCFRQTPPRLEGAIEAYRQAAQYDPDNATIGLSLGRASWTLAQVRGEDDTTYGRLLIQAREAYEGVLTLQPDHLKALEGVARVAIEQRDDVALAKAYRTIIRVAPDSPAAAQARRNLRARGFRL